MEDEEMLDQEEKPAAQVYKSAEEALRVVKEGAVDYNDAILEQFTQPGEDCTWCEEFYHSVRDVLMAADTPDDQKSYFAELLAISGKAENIAALVEAIKKFGYNEKSDIYAEALELALGGNEIVSYLGEQLSSDNELLRESATAALTNQGSRQAAELLYQQTAKSGDPDGFYSLGIGLGEFVPEEDALPYIQEIVGKRDQYSHLGVKALLNSGLPGLKILFDILASSKNPEFDRGMLKDATDHLTYDEEVETYLSGIEKSPPNALSAETAKTFLEDFRKTEEEDNEEPLQ